MPVGSKYVPTFYQQMQFTGIEYSVEPYMLNRPLTHFPHFCCILVVDKEDQSYPQALQLIKSFQLSLGKGTEIEPTSKFDRNRYKQHNAYIVDLRTNYDSEFESIRFKNCKDEKLVSAILETILDLSKGLIVLASNINDIPRVMYSRSHIGFTSKSDIEQFLKYGSNFHPAGENRLTTTGQLAPPVRSPEQIKNQTLCGYNNTLRKPTLQVIN